MVGGIGLATMQKAAKKNGEKIDKKMAQFKNRAGRSSSCKDRQAVSNLQVKQIPEEQLAKILADIQTSAARERKMNRARSLIVIAAIIAILALALLVSNKFW
ncbi:MAG: hypothetical protein LBL04_09760 [Bacteroidales bacterium]|jgi:hypothetical protein|nr:hypothetical protein [Bacteroidales bacterium]